MTRTAVPRREGGRGIEGAFDEPRSQFREMTAIIRMVDETRDFNERDDSVAVKLHGEPLTADEIARNFALYGLQKRTIALERFDSELRGEVDSSPHNLRRRVRLMALRKEMGGVHGVLREVKR